MLRLGEVRCDVKGCAVQHSHYWENVLLHGSYLKSETTWAVQDVEFGHKVFKYPYNLFIF